MLAASAEVDDQLEVKRFQESAVISIYQRIDFLRRFLLPTLKMIIGIINNNNNNNNIISNSMMLGKPRLSRQTMMIMTNQPTTMTTPRSEQSTRTIGVDTQFLHLPIRWSTQHLPISSSKQLRIPRQEIQRRRKAREKRIVIVDSLAQNISFLLK